MLQEKDNTFFRISQMIYSKNQAVLSFYFLLIEEFNATTLLIQPAHPVAVGEEGRGFGAECFR